MQELIGTGGATELEYEAAKEQAGAMAVEALAAHVLWERTNNRALDNMSDQLAQIRRDAEARRDEQSDEVLVREQDLLGDRVVLIEERDAIIERECRK